MGLLYRLTEMGRFDLVIFDCDGVLVDSERLAIRTEAEVLFHLGWPLTESEIVERFVGRSATYMHEVIEEHLGRPVDWETEFEARYEEVFAQELLPVPGVAEVVRQITVPMCVASSGSHEKMRFTLGLTGLLEVFGERLFSVDDVENGKPAPDVFLYAAEKMGVGPDRCAVVEDSVSGVTAGLAAGMTVLAFSGGVTNATRLSIGPAVVFDDMHMLPELLSGD
jgi:HAD superfamily hydrolase (TIGR01509 family)